MPDLIRLSPPALRARAAGAKIIGFVGFSRPLTLAELPRVDAAIETELAALNPPVFVVSGATATGVPERVHTIATRLGLPSVGFTARAATAFPLAPLDFLVIEGERFGDESSTFVETCDALVMIGGGPQAAREVRLARDQGKPVTIYRGFGGTADDL